MALVRAALCREDEHVGLSICVVSGHAGVHAQGVLFDPGMRWLHMRAIRFDQQPLNGNTRSQFFRRERVSSFEVPCLHRQACTASRIGLMRTKLKQFLARGSRSASVSAALDSALQSTVVKKGIRVEWYIHV